MTKQLAQLTLDIASEAQNVGLQGAEFHESSDGGFGVLFGSLMRAAMVIAAILVLVFLIWGAIEWITSAGDKGKVESARNKISNAVVGMVILAAVTAIFLVIQGWLGLNVLTFG